jgi:hypothetical protein
MDTPATLVAKLSNTFTIKVRLGGGEGKITFKKPKANADIKPEYDENSAESWAQFLVKQIVSVEGLVNENGDMVTIEQIQKKDIPMDLWSILVHGYSAGVSVPQTKEAAEKKFELLD